MHFSNQPPLEGRHLFPPVPSLLIHSKIFPIDTKLSKVWKAVINRMWWGFFFFFKSSVLISGHTYFNICFNSLDFYSAVHFNSGEVQLGWAWSSWGRSPEVTIIYVLSGCCITISFTFVRSIYVPFDIVVNFCFFWSDCNINLVERYLLLRHFGDCDIWMVLLLLLM